METFNVDLVSGFGKRPANFGITFPYLNTPIPGKFNHLPAAGTVFP